MVVSLRYRNYFINEEGFSLVEAIISVLLVALLAMGIAGMVGTFARTTQEDLINVCLVQAAISGIEAKRANIFLNSLNVSCGAYTVNVALSGNPPANPPDTGSGVSACVTVTATATIGSRSMIIRDKICNLPA